MRADVLVVLAFLSGALLTAGVFMESPWVCILGGIFGILFLFMAVVTAVQFGRDLRKKREFQRYMRGLK